jgi:hypothetical protein
MTYRYESDDLSQRCDEILAWCKTGIYEGTALQKMADDLEAHGMDFHLSPLRTAEQRTIKEALELVADLRTATPHLDDVSEPEPPLEDIVFRYYRPYFDHEKSVALTAEYFAKLRGAA